MAASPDPTPLDYPRSLRHRLDLSPVEIVASTLAIGLLLLASDLVDDVVDRPLFVASLGASIVLLFVQPRMTRMRSWGVIGGQLVGATAGLAAYAVADGSLAVAGMVAIALCLVGMHLLRCVHAPAAATALIVVTTPSTDDLSFLVFPVLAGSVFIVAVAWAVHLIEPHIPERWGGRVAPPTGLAGVPASSASTTGGRKNTGS